MKEQQLRDIRRLAHPQNSQPGTWKQVRQQTFPGPPPGPVRYGPISKCPHSIGHVAGPPPQPSVLGPPPPALSQPPCAGQTCKAWSLPRPLPSSPTHVGGSSPPVSRARSHPRYSDASSESPAVLTINKAAPSVPSQVLAVLFFSGNDHILTCDIMTCLSWWNTGFTRLGMLFTAIHSY